MDESESPPRSTKAGVDANAEGDETVSHWLLGLRDGESLAAQNLWNRYFERLVPIAQKRLARLARDRSGEDIALSAMKSMMIGVQENRFPSLHDREGLWPLLVTITARKAVSEQRRQLAASRSPNREVAYDDVADYLGVDPSPEFAVEVADELERLAIALADNDLKRLVELKLSGWTNDEIAEDLGCTTRTITRKLTRIRQEWAVASGMPLEDAP